MKKPLPKPNYDDSLDFIPDDDDDFDSRITMNKAEEQPRPSLMKKTAPEFDDDIDDLLLDDDLDDYKPQQPKPYQNNRFTSDRSLDDINERIHSGIERKPIDNRNNYYEDRNYQQNRIEPIYKEEPKITISPSEIEKKVNEKLSKELYNDDFDLLAPIEKNNYQDSDERYTYNAPREETKQSIPEAEYEPVREKHEESKPQDDRKVFSESKPLTLEEVDEDEQFFDDFFDD
jgi:hypothetical protein